MPSPWDSSAALFVVAETLIGELTRQLEADSAERIREMENLR
jgi:DNA-binding MurR/RpiR family transcriptional regulator